MLIKFNGKPIVGSGTEDEPPPSFHVLKHMIGKQVTAIQCESDDQPQSMKMVLSSEDGEGSDVEVTWSLRIEYPEGGGSVVELCMDVKPVEGSSGSHDPADFWKR